MTTLTKNHIVRHIGPDLELIEQRHYKTKAGAQRWCAELAEGGVRERGERVIVETTIVAVEPEREQ